LSFAEKILAELDRQMPFLRRAAASGTPPLEVRLLELDRIAARLATVLGADGAWIVPTVKSYVVLSLEFLRLQRELEKSGRYLLSSEREAIEKVYANPAVFGGYYLPGLLLSEALWPNHFAMNALYREVFLAQLPAAPRVIEVGVGTGWHLRELFAARPESVYSGFDVSAYAIDFGRRFAADTMGQAAFDLRNVADGLPAATGSADAIVCGEIIEHVERPDRLLKELRRVARGGAKLFVTTVVFAANIDHIYMFERAQEIRDLLAASDWRISDELVLPVYPGDSPDAVRRPMNYAAIAI
jgi:SAM-dependent methyltransferase